MPEMIRFRAALSDAAETLVMGELYKIRALSSDNRVTRYGYIQAKGDQLGYYGKFYLEAPLEEGNFSRVSEGVCPLLYNHGDLHLGVVERALTDTDLQLDVRWTRVPDEKRTEEQKIVAGLWDGVVQKTRNAYSIGFTAEYYEKKENTTEDGSPIYIARKWSLKEVSLVDIGADGRAASLLTEQEGFMDLDQLKKQIVEDMRQQLSSELLEKLRGEVKNEFLSAAKDSFRNELSAKSAVAELQKLKLLDATDAADFEQLFAEKPELMRKLKFNVAEANPPAAAVAEANPPANPGTNVNQPPPGKKTGKFSQLKDDMLEQALKDVKPDDFDWSDLLDSNA